MTCRPAAAADLAAVALLDGEAFGAEAYPAVFFRQAHDLWPTLLRVAEADDGLLVGYVLAAPADAAADAPAEAWVLSTAVSIAHRGRGVATALMADALAVLDRRGVHAVWLTVDPANPAVRLYTRLGFVRTRVEAAYFGPRTARLVMRRERPAG